MNKDPTRGKTIRWTFTDGPMAKKTFEHQFRRKRHGHLAHARRQRRGQSLRAGEVRIGRRRHKIFGRFRTSPPPATRSRSSSTFAPGSSRHSHRTRKISPFSAAHSKTVLTNTRAYEKVGTAPNRRTLTEQLPRPSFDRLRMRDERCRNTGKRRTSVRPFRSTDRASRSRNRRR